MYHMITIVFTVKNNQVNNHLSVTVKCFVAHDFLVLKPCDSCDKMSDNRVNKNNFVHKCSAGYVAVCVL